MQAMMKVTTTTRATRATATATKTQKMTAASARPRTWSFPQGFLLMTSRPKRSSCAPECCRPVLGAVSCTCATRTSARSSIACSGASPRSITACACGARRWTTPSAPRAGPRFCARSKPTPRSTIFSSSRRCASWTRPWISRAATRSSLRTSATACLISARCSACSAAVVWTR